MGFKSPVFKSGMVQNRLNKNLNLKLNKIKQNETLNVINKWNYKMLSLSTADSNILHT